ncbi:MAG: CTP--phosphocholine cytidylyltransferase, partial [Lachnospiraceae bacterium]|nr:CTP--phosphocholine cytidylyltransferase [Lachnospiraceae bacterium]
YWSEEDGKKLAEDIPEVYSSPGGKERYWEQVPLVYKKDHYSVEVRECRDEDIVEIDTFNELKAIDKTYDV